ncbi:MAG: hypothetical protein WBH56_00735, partial [Bacteroidota bacterium]
MASVKYGRSSRKWNVILPFVALAIWAALPANARAQESDSTVTSVSSAPAIPPAIDVWHGPTQSFGAVGTPQRDANIHGHVSGPLNSFSYSLNGGPARQLSTGPDTRRLSRDGDFTIDLRYAE